MKKVLFATTALVATAGIASAEISISGFAEMGIAGFDTSGVPGGDLAFHNDIGINIDMSGETDGGLTFGAHMELDDTNGSGAINGAWGSDNESVFISGGFGTLTLGEIDGAFDKRLKEVALAGGSITDDETAHAGYNGNGNFDGTEDNQILRYDYSFGDFGFSLSMEQNNNGASGDDIYALGVSYDMDMASGIALGFGLGYQTGGDVDFDAIGVSIYADFGNGFEAALNYTDYDDAVGGDGTHIGVGVAYTMDAFTFALNYGEYDYDAAGADSSGYGMVVNYDLGGGAVVQFGYGSSDLEVGADTDTYSLGIAMSF